MIRLLFIFLALIPTVFEQATFTSASSGFSKKKISCNIVADKLVYQKGETPKIIVSILNNTHKNIVLVRALDGSGELSRYPYSYFKVEKIDDPNYKLDFPGRCGNMDEIKLENFSAVAPGETFNPYKRIFSNRPEPNIYSYEFVLINNKNYETPGKYKISYFYSTNETAFNKWRGRPFPKQMDNEQYQKMLSIFEKVPKIDIQSDPIIIEVK